MAGLAFVLVATLTPTRDPRAAAAITPLLCLVCGEQGVADVAVNLLLFLPLAVGLRLSGESWTRTVLAAFLISFNVELLQYWLVPGRDASLSDLLTNTASGAIGATIGTHLPRWSFPEPARATVLAVAWLAMVLLVLATGGWLLEPGVPDGPLISRWVSGAPGTDSLRVRVQSLHLDGAPVPASGLPDEAAAVRARLASGVFTLDAQLISGRPVPDRRWIYMLRAPSGDVLTLEQWDRHAGAAIPVRGLRYKLHHPVVPLAQGFPGSAGMPVRLQVSDSSRRIHLSSRYGDVERSTILGLSPAFGWALFVPFELTAGLGVRWVTGFVLLVMLLPLGYWAAWVHPRRRSIFLLATGMVAALVVLPAAAGFPPVHWSEWLAGAIGALAGWSLQLTAADLAKRRADSSAAP